MKSTNLAFLLLLVFITTPLFSQSEADLKKAKELTSQAIKLMDDGKLQQSIDVLKEAQTLDPKNLDIQYEIGLAQYQQGNFSQAIKITKKISKHQDAQPAYFALMGNAYDMDGDRKKAEKAYQKGIKAFPDAGLIYTELGILSYNNKLYSDALMYWETGIDRDPFHASNYYWAAKLFTQTDERIWAILYGEIFLNMKPSGKRADEISKLIFQTYLDAIEVTSDTSATTHFSKRGNTIVISDPDDLIKMSMQGRLLPFEGTVELAFAPGLMHLMDDDIMIENLDQARQLFIKSWFGEEKELGKGYPNDLFDYQKRLDESGHFKAYNYWLLKAGDPDSFKAYLAAGGKKELDEFFEWDKENQMEITEDNFLGRLRFLK